MKPKIYYIKGRAYKGIELSKEEQLVLIRENLKRLREQGFIKKEGNKK